jgi:hypothetical protein
MSYQASGTIKCWKKYDCLGCGAVFRHKFERAVSGQGGTAEQAEANAQRAGITALQNQVDTVPCPECGRVQPRMVGHAKNNTHFVLLWLFLIAGFVLLMVGATDTISRDASAYGTAGIAAVALLAHFLVAKSDPNANPDANREAALSKVQSGAVEVIRAGDTSNGEPPPPLTTKGHTVYFAVALVAVLVALVPVALRHLNGWALGDADPPVIGPGDKFRITFPAKIDCVKSTWRGTALNVQFDGEPIKGVAAFTHEEQWGSLYVKPSERSTSPALWADLVLPPDASLQDREISGTVTMVVVYPSATGPNTMQDRNLTVTQKFKVKLSKVNAWAQFRAFWWAGVSASVVLTVLAGWGLARLAARMKWDSPPDLVESLDTPPEDLPPDELARRRDEARAAGEQQQQDQSARKPWER